MRYSLTALLLFVLVGAVYLSAWEQPQALLVHACRAILLLAIAAAAFCSMSRREAWKWKARGFAATGIALSLALWFGEPLPWSGLPIDRLALGSAYPNRQNILQRQAELRHMAGGSIARYERRYHRPYDPIQSAQVLARSTTREEARLAVGRAAFLFVASLAGGTIVEVCRRDRRWVLVFFTLCTAGAIAFNATCLLIAWRLWPISATTATGLALLVALVLLISSQPPIRGAALAYLIVCGSYLGWAIDGEIRYFSDEDSTIRPLYNLVVPKAKQTGAWYIANGTSVYTPDIKGNLHLPEFARIFHCLLATTFGTISAFAAILWQRYRHKRRRA